MPFYRGWSLLNKDLLVFVLFYCTSFTLASPVLIDLLAWMFFFNAGNSTPQMAIPIFFPSELSILSADSATSILLVVLLFDVGIFLVYPHSQHPTNIRLVLIVKLVFVFCCQVDSIFQEVHNFLSVVLCP